MRIGKDGYDIPTFNPEEEKQIKLQDEVENDWLDCDNKEEILEDYYPDGIGLDDEDEMYDGLSWEQKLEIYLDRNPENKMNPDDYPFQRYRNGTGRG
jgi:hypothetical protein